VRPMTPPDRRPRGLAAAKSAKRHARGRSRCSSIAGEDRPCRGQLGRWMVRSRSGGPSTTRLGGDRERRLRPVSSVSCESSHGSSADDCRSSRVMPWECARSAVALPVARRCTGRRPADRRRVGSTARRSPHRGRRSPRPRVADRIVGPRVNWFSRLLSAHVYPPRTPKLEAEAGLEMTLDPGGGCPLSLTEHGEYSRPPSRKPRA